MENKKLSIITINRNNAEGLHKTMASVFLQTYHNFEYIVVDGASTDESVDVIKASALQAEGLDFKWISEPDTGIYNAMNKGLRMSHGEYTLMLNSGDYLVDEHVIERILPELDGADIVQGNNIEERDGAVYRNRGYGKSDINLFDVLKGHFLHQASFCRRELFDKYGYFDESYRICADTKFFMNCTGVNNATFKYVDIDVCNYDCNGVSAPQAGQWNKQGKAEYIRLKDELFSQRLVDHYNINAKKIHLYDKLHQHMWGWRITIALSWLIDRVYGVYSDHPTLQRVQKENKVK